MITRTRAGVTLATPPRHDNGLTDFGSSGCQCSAQSFVRGSQSAQTGCERLVVARHERPLQATDDTGLLCGDGRARVEPQLRAEGGTLPRFAGFAAAFIDQRERTGRRSSGKSMESHSRVPLPCSRPQPSSQGHAGVQQVRLPKR